MNLEFIENKHPEDKTRFIGEEFTYIAELIMNGKPYGHGVTTIGQLRRRINEDRV